MNYEQGDTLVAGKRYTASFTTGHDPLSGNNQSEVLTWQQAIPWITASSWTDGPIGSGVAEWNFTLVSSIDAAALGDTLEQVLSTFDPAGDYSFAQMSDPGEGLAAAASKGGCSLSNLDACFGNLQTLGWMTLAGLALVVVIKLT